MAEVRIDAEREAGEVAEPGEHSLHVLDRKAIDEERADAHLLETTRGPPEEISFGRTPVLPVDAAHSVSTAAEGQPDRQARLEHPLDCLERLRVADEGQRLEQDQVRRVLLEDPGEELDRPPSRL